MSLFPLAPAESTLFPQVCEGEKKRGILECDGSETESENNGHVCLCSCLVIIGML